MPLLLRREIQPDIPIVVQYVMRWFLTEGHWRTASLLSDIIPINGAWSPLGS